MDKALYAASFLLAVVLITGNALAPNSTFMWLASTSMLMDVFRLIVAALMLGLLFTEPPRSMAFRLALGLGGVLFGSLAAAPILSGGINLLDVLLFASASVCFLLAAVEAEPLPAAIPEQSALPEKADHLGGSWLTGMSKRIIAVSLLAQTHLRSLHVLRASSIGHGHHKRWHTPTISAAGSGRSP